MLIKIQRKDEKEEEKKREEKKRKEKKREEKRREKGIRMKEKTQQFNCQLLWVFPGF